MLVKTTRILVAAAAVLAVTIGSIGSAQAGTLAAPAGNQFIEEMKTLQPQLNLSTTQQTAYDVAMDTMRQSHVTARMNEDQLQQQFQSAQQTPILDLRAIHAANLKVEKEDAQAREQSANAWINFYDGLNNSQKTSVSSLLKEQFAAIQNHPGKPYEPGTGL
jgi:periplasmic protein CpxP/Spy